MKLVIATPSYPPEIGGPATYSKLLFEKLPEKEIEVELVKFSDVRHWWFPKGVRHFVYYHRVLKAARQADAVLALDPVSVGLPAMYAARKVGKPFVVKIVGDYAWEQGQQRFKITQNLDDFVRTEQKNFFVKKLQGIQKLVAQSADKIIVPSEYLKDIVIQWGIPDGKITVINNSIQLPVHIPVFEKKKEEFLIVSAGRRVPWKGFEAIERLQKERPYWRVFIASDLPREQALGWMKTADVFVLNSSYEGFPHALVEAMTLGTPVIATDTRGNRAVAGESALYIPQGDEEALLKAVKDTECDYTAASERALAGQARMKQFELSSMLDVTASFFKSI
jgi:glycosyltransferase involved in cell wall biosynthesis